jgi:outer membrane cobalamin receptor
VTVGGSYGHEDGSSNDVIDFGGFGVPASFALQRGTLAAFAEAAWTPLAGLQLGAGIRRDHPESAASETVGQLSAAYRLDATGTRVHAEWSQGFKLPSFFALGHPLVGNPNLRPEHSTQVEAGISQALLDGAVHLDLTWFHARYRDLIDFDPVAFTNFNRGRVSAQGLEGGLEVQLGDGLSATANATLNDLDVAPGAAPLRRRPRWKGGAGLRWAATPRWTTRLDATWWGEYFDSSIPTGLVRMPGYWRLDASARWQASKRTAVSFSVRNLLGDDYESSIGFPNGGASGFVSVEFAL